MKKVSIFIALAIAMCALNQANGQSNAPQMQQQQKQEFENFYFSQKHHEWIDYLMKDGIKAITHNSETPLNHSQVNGKYYTYCCDERYFNDNYKKQFPDAVLVARLPKGKGKITVHY